MPPWPYYSPQAPPPDDDEDLAAAYENMIRGLPQGTGMEPPDRQLGLMGLLRQPRFYGPSQGIAGPVPRGTPAPRPMYGPPAPPPEAAMPYEAAMGVPEAEPYGPPERAIRVSEQAPYGEESGYRRIVDEYLRGLQQPYRLPERIPYSRREKLGLLAAREPWQREMIVERHREPYERAMAEAQIGERRAQRAAGVASDIEKAQAYERYRMARAGAPSRQLDYTDKVEKAHADKGNADYPYTKQQWKALADFNAKATGLKTLPLTKEDMLNEIDKDLRDEEDQIMQAQGGGAFGAIMPEDMMEEPRTGIMEGAKERRGRLAARRKFFARMTEDIYRKFAGLTAEQRAEAIATYEKRLAESEQLGPVAPAPSYYP